jgi:hypothetical protein
MRKVQLLNGDYMILDDAPSKTARRRRQKQELLGSLVMLFYATAFVIVLIEWMLWSE